MSRKDYHQSVYIPQNPSKYVGKKQILMRSSWERKIATFLDTNNNILEWCSEGLAIPYLDHSDNKMHRYYPDFIIKLLDKNGLEKNIIAEVKPFRETLPPKKPKVMSKSYVEALQTYHKNLSKWEAASEYCKKNNIEFRILTEKNVGV